MVDITTRVEQLSADVFRPSRDLEVIKSPSSPPAAPAVRLRPLGVASDIEALDDPWLE